MNAGWYADPNGGPDLRWWDGNAWTEHTSPQGADPAADSSPPSDAAPATDPTPPSDPTPAGDSAPAADPTVPHAAGPDAIPPAPAGVGPGPAGFGAPGGSGGYAPPGPGTGSGGYPPHPGTGPGGYPPDPATGGFAPGPPPPRNDSSKPLLIGLVALIVVLLGVGGFVVFSGGDDDETTADTTTTTTEAPDDTTTTADDGTTTTTAANEPDSEFISSGGLTFTRLPEPWQDWVSNGQGQIAELQGTAGQFVVVQEQAPSGGQWIGNLLIGDLASSITYSGEADLSTATHELADTLIASYYVEGASASIVRETELEIDGHPAYFIHHELTFQQEGLETTREKVIVVLVDTGRPRPGVFWASIPYNRIDLNEGMDEVYRTLQVND